MIFVLNASLQIKMAAIINTFQFTNKLSFEEIIATCAKIIQWLITECIGNHKQCVHIEDVVRAFVILSECQSVCGPEMLKQIMSICPCFESGLKDTLENRFGDKPSSPLCRFFATIMNTFSGSDQLLLLEKSPLPIEIIDEIAEITLSDSYKAPTLQSRDKMLRLANRILQVPREDLQSAVRHMLAEFEFDIVGYVFCEPLNSPHVCRLAVIEEIICNEMEGYSINHSFIDSIYITASTSNQGLEFLTKCLQNSLKLYTSLHKYFIEFLKDGSQDSPKNPATLTNVVNLIQIMCYVNLPERHIQHEQSYRSNVRRLLEETFQDIALIYDF